MAFILFLVMCVFKSQFSLMYHIGIELLISMILAIMVQWSYVQPKQFEVKVQHQSNNFAMHKAPFRCSSY
jgi:ABC-type transport system involved in cytochrome bd biosynthesis fused ATPase/permease subunit